MRKLLSLLLLLLPCAASLAGTKISELTNTPSAVLTDIIPINTNAAAGAPNTHTRSMTVSNLFGTYTGRLQAQPVTDTNALPVNITDRYGSNLFSLNPSHAGSNYWHVLIGDFTPNHELGINISDVIWKMTQNGYWQIDFGSTTNAFWSFGSTFSWGDPTGETQDLFDRQARFFPQHIAPRPVNNDLGPGVAAGSAAGSGASVSVTSPNSGTDVALRVQLTTGASGLAAGTLLTVTYRLAYGSAPHVVFSPSPGSTNAAAASPVLYPISSSTTTFVLGTTAALVASKTYTWDIITIE